MIAPAATSIVAFEFPLLFDEFRFAPDSYAADVTLDARWWLEFASGDRIEIGGVKRETAVVSRERWEEMFRPVQTRLKVQHRRTSKPEAWPQ